MANLNSHFQPHLSPAQFELNRAGEKETLQEDKLRHEVLSSRKIKRMHEDWMNWKTRRNRCSLGRHSYEDVLMKIEDVCYGHKTKIEVWCYGADITRRTNEIQQNQSKCSAEELSWHAVLVRQIVVRAGAVRSRHCSDELQDDEGLDEFSERREMAEKNRVCEKELHTSSLSKVLVLRVRWIRTIGKSATRAQSETCKST